MSVEQKYQPHFQGYEILSFEGVELIQIQEEKKHFLDIGTLLVLYFREQVRFVLSLNNWTYPLLKQLFVLSYTSKKKSHTQSYIFQSSGGYYLLNFTKPPHSAALKNFETILKNNTRFYLQGEEATYLKLLYDSEKIEEFLEEGGFHELSASERIKRSLAKVADRISRPFVKSLHENPNLVQVKSFEELKKFSSEQLSSHEFLKEELERLVLRNQELSKQTVGATREVRIVHKEEKLIYEIYNHFEVSKEEQRLWKEIEQEILIQEEAIKKQKEYALKEQKSREREEELYRRLRIEMSEREDYQGTLLEKLMDDEYSRYDRVIRSQEEEIQLERAEFEEREKELKEEILKLETELKEQERLGELSRQEFKKKETLLLRKGQQRKGEKKALVHTEKKITERVKLEELELEKKERLAHEELDKMARMEKEMQRKLKERLDELEQKEKLTEQEKNEVKQKEKELEEILKQEYMEREKLTEEMRRGEEEIEAERRILKQKEEELERAKLEFSEHMKEMEEAKRKEELILETLGQWNELIRMQLDRNKVELQMESELNRAEELDFLVKRKSAEEKLKMKEEELMQMEMLTEKEKNGLETLRKKLFEMKEITESERIEFEKKKDAIFESVNQRDMELKQEKGLIEGERMRLARSEEQERLKLAEWEKEIEQKELEIRTMEEKIEKQRKEFSQQTHEVKITKQEKKDLDRILKQNQKLIAQNQEVFKEEVRMQQQVEKLAHTSIVEETTKSNVSISRREERTRAETKTQEKTQKDESQNMAAMG